MRIQFFTDAFSFYILPAIRIWIDCDVYLELVWLKWGISIKIK
jgi:hypothetical protein